MTLNEKIKFSIILPLTLSILFDLFSLKRKIQPFNYFQIGYDGLLNSIIYAGSFFLVSILCFLIVSYKKLDSQPKKISALTFFGILLSAPVFISSNQSLLFLTLFFLLFYLGCFILNHLKIKHSYQIILIIFIFSFINIFAMSIFERKQDTLLFTQIFKDNKLFINQSKVVKKNNFELQYKYLNCCDSEKYYESGQKPGGFLLNHEDEVIFITGDASFYKVQKNNLYETVIFTRKIKSNLDEVINNPLLNKVSKVSVRGVAIYGNLFFITYTNEVSDKCYNLQVAYSEINDLNNLEFKDFTNFVECVKITDIYNTQLHESGGALAFNHKNLYLSVGNFGSYYSAQNENSIFGKILKIDLDTKEVTIFSKGHRNIQGMVVQNNLLYAVEHGPKGGDELNVIDLNIKNKIQNFGWPLSSYGDHYDGLFRLNAPLYKSHKLFGFEEPALYFTPSIGISDIKLKDDKFVISSMKANKLYILNKKLKENVVDEFHINTQHRIRDILIVGDDILLFLESLPGIAILSYQDN